MCNYMTIYSFQSRFAAWSEGFVLLLGSMVWTLAVGFKYGDDDNRGSGR